MKNAIVVLLFFFIYLEAKSQHPDYVNFIYKRIDHKFDNYKTPEILDALFILNGDTIKYRTDLGYPILKTNLKNKVNVRITHSNYESLLLDSVWLGNLYLFEKKEAFYIENGMPISLFHGKKHIAIKIRKNNNTPKKAKAIINRICNTYQLNISVSFQDSIKKVNKQYGESSSQKIYGCLEDELDYIFWLEKKQNTDFDYQNKIYKRIRKKKPIKWLGIPQEYSSYLLNGIEIEFKNNMDTTDIDLLINHYNLELESVYSSRRVSNYKVYHFTTANLIPNNTLMKALMKEPIVKYARPKKLIYDRCL